MTFDAPANQISLVRHQPIITAVLHHLAIARHCSKTPLKRVLLGRFDVEQIAELRELQRHPLRRHGVEDEFAAWQRHVVFLPFALEMRISFSTD